MSAELGDERALLALLAALAAPAVLVDRGGLVAAWNDAAEVRFGLSADGPGQPISSLVGPQADAGRSVALTDGTGSIVFWPLDDDGVDPDDLALQKADALGRVAGGIKHDIENKYQAITGICELLGSDPRVPADLRDMAGELSSAANMALGLTRTALERVRHSPRQLALVSVGKVVRETVEALAFALMNVEWRVSIPDTLPEVEADLALLRQAILALLMNAIEAQGGTWVGRPNAASGQLLISGSVRDDERGRRVRLAIEDGGDVVPVAERPGLFVGSGAPRAGRDLAVARAIIAQTGGRLSYEPVTGGNRIVVELPIAGTVLPPVPPPGPASSSTLAEPMSEATRPLVLICDDEPLIRGLLTRILERVGVAVVEARDANEALAAVDSQPIRMIVADHQMPDVNGSDLYDLVVARHPELATQFILTSGDAGRPDIAAFRARTGVTVVPKPFDSDRLARLIREALAD